MFLGYLFYFAIARQQVVLRAPMVLVLIVSPDGVFLGRGL